MDSIGLDILSHMFLGVFGKTLLVWVILFDISWVMLCL